MDTNEESDDKCMRDVASKLRNEVNSFVGDVTRNGGFTCRFRFEKSLLNRILDDALHLACLSESGKDIKNKSIHKINDAEERTLKIIKAARYLLNASRSVSYRFPKVKNDFEMAQASRELSELLDKEER